MSQYNFGTIDPSVKTGTELAADLNNWRTALHSCHSGATRPSYAIANMIWIDTSRAPLFDVMVFDGTADNLMFTINTDTHTASVVRTDSATGAADIPSGTTAQRPVAPEFGFVRANTTTGAMEWWNGTLWAAIGGGAQGGGNNNLVFFENDIHVTASYTITTGKNAGSFGPIIIDDGVTVTVPAGSVWSVV